MQILGSGSEGVGSGKRPRWLGVCKHETWEICQGFTVPVLHVAFFRGESWGTLQNRSLKTTVAPTAWLVRVALGLLSCSETSLLHWSLGGVD